MLDQFITRIAAELNLPATKVSATARLLGGRFLWRSSALKLAHYGARPLWYSLVLVIARSGPR